MDLVLFWLPEKEIWIQWSSQENDKREAKIMFNICVLHVQLKTILSWCMLKQIQYAQIMLSIDYL